MQTQLCPYKSQQPQQLRAAIYVRVSSVQQEREGASLEPRAARSARERDG
jgi:hypothetical protein